MTEQTKKIVFIEPPVSLEEMYGELSKVASVSPPMNIMLLAAIVRGDGFDPYILDCPALNFGYEDVVDRLKVIKPKFVAITAMTPHIIQANKLAEIIKLAFPEIIVLLGGAHLSAVPEETMNRFPSIDIGVTGEGDVTLLEILHGVTDGKWLGDIKGLVFRDNGKIINTGRRHDKIEMDTLPIYAWDLLEGYPDRYKTPIFSTHNEPATPVITSRGCPAKCTFCYSGGHSNLSTYSADYTVGMFNHLKDRYGIQELMIYDDNFVMYRKNMLKLLNKMIDDQINLSWSCNARIDLVNEEVLALMARAGCWQISYGVETGNQKIMDSLQKNLTKEKVARTIGWSKMAGIRTVGYFMIGHFGETIDTIKETVEFAMEIGLDDYRCSFFTPLPGTHSNQVAKEFGEFDPENWGAMTLNQPVFIPHGFTKDELIRWRKWAIRKFFFRPRPVYSYMKMVRNHPMKAVKGAWHVGRYMFQ